MECDPIYFYCQDNISIHIIKSKRRLLDSLQSMVSLKNFFFNDHCLCPTDQSLENVIILLSYHLKLFSWPPDNLWLIVFASFVEHWAALKHPKACVISAVRTGLSHPSCLLRLHSCGRIHPGKALNWALEALGSCPCNVDGSLLLSRPHFCI